MKVRITEHESFIVVDAKKYWWKPYETIRVITKTNTDYKVKMEMGIAIKEINGDIV